MVVTIVRHRKITTVHHHDQECHAKSLGSYLQGQGHWAETLKNNVLPYFLNFYIFATEDGHNGASSVTGVFCGIFKKIAVLIIKVSVRVEIFRNIFICLVL